MPPVSDPDIWSAAEYRKTVGEEPISGYVLIEPLGRGGFGEVWKCEAPGGLHKAIKFVAGAAGPDDDGRQLQQEYEAFQKIKAIRHPFLLTLERVELVGNELVMVMELADRQLADRFQECREQGLPGIPRRELLDYFEEAAEALDVISAQYGLQHLDVKPANLFLTAGHVKVGDYGLVKKLDAASGMAPGSCGLTPKYVAPEVLRGEVHTRSDQYSLALVYQELLTGKFPYAARTTQQMMLAHVSAQPDVSPLPRCDQSPVFTALQKRPEDRFTSCQEFIEALLEAGWAEAQSPRASLASIQIPRSGTVPNQPRRIEVTPAPAGEETGRHPKPDESTATAPPEFRGARPGDRTNTVADKTMPLPPRESLPGLITAGQRPVPIETPPPATRPPATPPPVEELPIAEAEPDTHIRIRKIRSIIHAVQLTGADARRPDKSPNDFIEAVLAAAAAGGYVPQIPGDIGREPGGTWVCRFPTTVPAPVVLLKLDVLRDHWGVAIEQPEPGRIVLKKTSRAGFWGKKGGFEVVVHLPRAARSIGEMSVSGSIFGSPDKQLVQAAEDALPKIIGEIRASLGNVADRRKTPRVAVSLPVTVHPLHSDGRLDPPISGTTLDVSLGGIGFETTEKFRSKYFYVAFPGIVATRDLVILTRVMRRSQAMQGEATFLYGGQYRSDL